MTTQSTSATFLGRSGKVYTFENTTVTDGTAGEEMLSGPSPYALTAQSLGDYAQGDVLVAGLVTAQGNIGCAYVSYGGEWFCKSLQMLYLLLNIIWLLKQVHNLIYLVILQQVRPQEN